MLQSQHVSKSLGDIGAPSGRPKEDVGKASKLNTEAVRKGEVVKDIVG